ncbi:Terpene cyclase [Mycena sanguinolenta]|uniref:Terpene synthase n=1 Tax=Mycena sanguinolenta TaxID=230812 RepID=A0A8H6XJT4_9AGAR|nr:Terpene cyclase [Mycena sanguinolenta]
MPEPTSTEFILPNTMADWPWLRRINPHFETVKAESEAWFRNFNAFSPKAQKAFEKCDFCRLASLAYPALNKQRLRTGCDLMMLFFTFDEYTDVLPAPEVRRYADIVMDALKNPTKPRPEGEHVVGEVARQFWALGIQSATPLAQKHFLNTFEDYIYSVVDQASDRDNERIRGSEEYMTLRRRTIGLHPSYPMQELGMDLADEIWNHPVVDELRRIAVDIVLLDNDICSYKKELAQDDATVCYMCFSYIQLFSEPSFPTQHNIVTIIMHEKTTDVRGAMEWVATRRKALTSQFIALYKKVPWDDTDAQIREYVEGIANWPRANDSWIFESGRYFGSEGLKVQKDRKVVLSRPGSAKFLE